jgi:hypothetical protein
MMRGLFRTYFERTAMTASLVRWELAWISVELCAVGIGLWLMLATPFSELGSWALLTFCMAGFFVRFRHYYVLRAK